MCVGSGISKCFRDHPVFGGVNNINDVALHFASFCVFPDNCVSTIYTKKMI